MSLVVLPAAEPAAIQGSFDPGEGLGGVGVMPGGTRPGEARRRHRQGGLRRRP